MSTTSKVSNKISRRQLLKAFGLAAGGAALSACAAPVAPAAPAAPAQKEAPAGQAQAPTSAPAAAGGAKNIEFWAFAKDRTGFVEELIKGNTWKSMQPDATVNFRILPYEEMHNKLLTALTAGQGAPDIADVEISRFAKFIKGDRVGFVPLNDKIGDEIKNLYTAAATDPWTWKGTIYGLGNELNTVAFAYRKDMMDELGVNGPFETWDDTIAAGKKLVEGGKAKMYAVHDIHFGDLYMLSQSAGTTFFDENGEYIGDNDKNVEALQFLQDLVYKNKIAGIAPATGQNDWWPPEYNAAFNAGQFAAVWGPPWHLGGFQLNVKDLAGKWLMQMLPKGLGDSRPTANFGGTGQQITEQSKNVDVAWDLIKLSNLTKEGVLTDFKLRTAYPSYKPAYEDPALKQPSEYFGGVKVGEIYASVADQLPPFRNSTVWPEATEAMKSIVITPVMQNKKEPKAALVELRAEIDRLKKLAS